MKTENYDEMRVIFRDLRRLIAYYGKKLDEDGTNKLTLFLLEMIEKEKAISKKYCAVALRNEYIRLSKNEVSHKTDFAELREDIAENQTDKDTKIDLKKAVEKLNASQRLIIELRYFCGFSVAEIAKKTSVTRQAVNQSINRALDKLKNFV